ncbi:hypothetical protein E4I81_09125 [Campylobacter jejuni]|nr:hypothetical protein [Campylobacter jejuni]
MISITLLFFLVGLTKPMSGFLFDVKNTLMFGVDLPYVEIFAVLVDLMMAISIFFAYAQLAYSFSIKDCMVYLVCGKIDKEWLKGIQK